MPAGINDYFSQTKTSGTTRPVATTLSAQKLVAATTASLQSTSGWDTGTVVHGILYRVDASNKKIAGSQIDWKGIVSGTTITSFTVTAGTDDTYAAGSVIELAPTAEWADLMAQGALIHADQDGTLKAGAVDVAAVVADGILTAAKSTTATNIETRGSETIFDHVASGCVITGDAYGSTLKWSMTAGVVYIGGVRVVVSALTAQDVVASKDTYIDVNSSGTVTFTGGNSVANNAASPALAANSIRLGIIQSGANIASVAAVNQGQLDKVLPIASSIAYTTTDSLGNLICPRDPSRKILGYRQIVASINTTSTSVVQATGLSCPVIIPTGRKARVTFFATQLSSTAATGTNVGAVWSGTVGSGTRIAQQNDTITAANVATHINVAGYVTGTGSLVTYNAGYYHDSAGTHTITAGSDQAAYVVVELE